MERPKLIFRGPLLTASGYGVHSRQLLRGLLAAGKFDVSVIATSWGQTPFLSDKTPFVELIKRLAFKHEKERQAKIQYDVSVQVTIPNEFEKMARVNIGVTAGIESNAVSPEWVTKVDEMDLVIVPSKHSKDVFGKTKTEIRVVPEGVDTRIFNTTSTDVAELDLQLPASFNFLCVGLGLDKAYGQDRKNIANLIKWFCETFKDNPNVGLVLKIGIVNDSQMDFDACKRRIKMIKRATNAESAQIHLIHGRLSDEQMAALYKHPKIKAFISLTHGEGFGLPLLEAAACGLPVIVPAWSGHIDFLHVDGKRRFIPVEHELKNIPTAAVWKGVMEEGTMWAESKESDAKLKMQKVVSSYEKPKEWADELAVHVEKNYSIEKVSLQFAKEIFDFVASFREKHPTTPTEFVENTKKSIGLREGKKTLLYTMPMSAGDVLISTAVVAGLKKKFPEHDIYFATDAKFVEILQDDPSIYRVIQWTGWMSNIGLCEKIFDEVYTPNLGIQLVYSNWVHGGKGRLLGEEMANNCQVELGEYHIKTEKPEIELPPKYFVLHAGSGKDKWSARNYLGWEDVVFNLSRDLSVPIVQVGTTDEPLIPGCTDLRGKTKNYNQLAFVVQNASMTIGIDSVVMHMAAALGTRHLAIFGGSYPGSTGPVKSNGLNVLLETTDRYTCTKACYKDACEVRPDHPCINEISPRSIYEKAMDLCGAGSPGTFEERFPKISGYTHVLNPERAGYPYVESIMSMAGFCDEVIVVDGGSDDGSLERLRELSKNDPSIKIVERKWDWSEPGMDGMQKAFARTVCTGEYLWQQDADEVVHEDDYLKIKRLAKKFPKDVDVFHLPIIELWGDPTTVRTDRHAWKWRLSRNNFRITHGIVAQARVVDEKTGKTYAKKGMSDGCEYIDMISGEFLKHRGFYTQDIENLRKTDPVAYGSKMNSIFTELPSVFHYSWLDIARKISNFKQFWNKCWSNLYNDPQPEDRFPGVETAEQIKETAELMRNQGGEHENAVTFSLSRSQPKVMSAWLSHIGHES